MIDRTVLFGAPEDATETRTFRVFPKSGPDRWMLETRFRKPWHLKTWPRANFRARVINRVVWTMGALGLHLPAEVNIADHGQRVRNLCYGQAVLLYIFHSRAAHQPPALDQLKARQIGKEVAHGVGSVSGVATAALIA